MGLVQGLLWKQELELVGAVPVPFAVVQFMRCMKVLDAGGTWGLQPGMPCTHRAKLVRGVCPERHMVQLFSALTAYCNPLGSSSQSS